MSPLLEVTEDTPPDMLTGSMELRLVLPDGTRVPFTVDRRTPMMDLLVQATTSHRIPPGGYVLQPYGETGLLPYKPSTPIGALDTWTVQIVPKSQAIQNPASKINLKQLVPPFEQTVRFQVKLPRNQLYVSRLSRRTTLGDVLRQVCQEKNLDPNKYTLRHPKRLDKGLSVEMSIAEYGENQVTMLSLKELPTAVSTDDILLMNKRLEADKGRVEGAGSTAGSSSSGTSSGGSSSVSPVPRAAPAVLPSAATGQVKPSAAGGRKRKPAPPPPPPGGHQPQNDVGISHSRTSSDSSGYHESSLLSESPDSNPNLSRPVGAGVGRPSESVLSRSLSNLHQASTSCQLSTGLKSAQSTSSLLAGRKKKRAPPPPPVAIAEEREEKSATLPAGVKLLESSTPPQGEEADAGGILHPRSSRNLTKSSPKVVSCSETDACSSKKLSASLSSLNSASSNEIPCGLVKRLSQQLFNDPQIPQPPKFPPNSEGVVSNALKKYETVTKFEMSSNKVPDKNCGFPNKDCVSILPSAVIEELQARLASAPSVKSLLQRFETKDKFEEAIPLEVDVRAEFFAHNQSNLSKQTSPQLMLPPPLSSAHSTINSYKDVNTSSVYYSGQLVLDDHFRSSRSMEDVRDNLDSFDTTRKRCFSYADPNLLKDQFNKHSISKSGVNGCVDVYKKSVGKVDQFTPLKGSLRLYINPGPSLCQGIGYNEGSAETPILESEFNEKTVDKVENGVSKNPISELGFDEAILHRNRGTLSQHEISDTVDSLGPNENRDIDSGVLHRVTLNKVDDASSLLEPDCKRPDFKLATDSNMLQYPRTTSKVDEVSDFLKEDQILPCFGIEIAKFNSNESFTSSDDEKSVNSEELVIPEPASDQTSLKMTFKKPEVSLTNLASPSKGILKNDHQVEGNRFSITSSNLNVRVGEMSRASPERLNNQESSNPSSAPCESTNLLSVGASSSASEISKPNEGSVNFARVTSFLSSPEDINNSSTSSGRRQSTVSTVSYVPMSFSLVEVSNPVNEISKHHEDSINTKVETAFVSPERLKSTATSFDRRQSALSAVSYVPMKLSSVEFPNQEIDVTNNHEESGEKPILPSPERVDCTAPASKRRQSTVSAVSYESMKLSPDEVSKLESQILKPNPGGTSLYATPQRKKCQGISITRRHSILSAVSYESIKCPSLEVPEGTVKGNKVSKTVKFSECDVIEEISSEDSSEKSSQKRTMAIKKKKKFTSPLHFNFLKRKGRPIIDKSIKPEKANDGGSWKSNGYCHCESPDIMLVRVPQHGQPSRNSAFKLKRSNSQLSDHTYLAMNHSRSSGSSDEPVVARRLVARGEPEEATTCRVAPKPRPRSWVPSGVHRPPPPPPSSDCVFHRLEEIFQKISGLPPPLPAANVEEEEVAAGLRLEAEIEEMFDAATREHVSLESGLELSRGPSPAAASVDWASWEYKLPAPPTFRDEVSTGSLGPELPSPDSTSREDSLTQNSRETYENPTPPPLLSTPSNSETDLLINNEVSLKLEEMVNDSKSIPAVDNGISNNKLNLVNGHSIYENGFTEKIDDFTECDSSLNGMKKTEKIYIKPENSVITEEIINATPQVEIHPDIIKENQKNSQIVIDTVPNKIETKSKIVRISITSENVDKAMEMKDNIGNGVLVNHKEFGEYQENLNNNNKSAGIHMQPSVEEKVVSVSSRNGVKNMSDKKSAVLSELSSVISNGISKRKELESDGVCENHMQEINKLSKDNKEKEVKNNVNNKSAVMNELSSVISDGVAKRSEAVKSSTLSEFNSQPTTAPLKNFTITTYSGSSRPLEIYKERHSPSPQPVQEVPPAEVRQSAEVKARGELTRSKSSVQDKKWSPVKRSVSVVSNLLPRAADISKSTTNLAEMEGFTDRKFQSNLRKSSSELSINIDSEEGNEIIRKEGSGLQSLQVLRSILPQLSQSQGALHKIAQAQDREPEKPAVSLTSWTERPKRPVSIKWDGDYVMNKGKLDNQAEKHQGGSSPSRQLNPGPGILRSISNQSSSLKKQWSLVENQGSSSSLNSAKTMEKQISLTEETNSYQNSRTYPALISQEKRLEKSAEQIPGPSILKGSSRTTSVGQKIMEERSEGNSSSSGPDISKTHSGMLTFKSLAKQAFISDENSSLKNPGQGILRNSSRTLSYIENHGDSMNGRPEPSSPTPSDKPKTSSTMLTFKYPVNEASVTDAEVSKIPGPGILKSSSRSTNLSSANKLLDKQASVTVEVNGTDSNLRTSHHNAVYNPVEKQTSLIEQRLESNSSQKESSSKSSEKPTSQTEELVEPTPPPVAHPPAHPVARSTSRSSSVYKSLETGNTKVIKLSPADLGRVPVVTAVELKKQPSLPLQASLVKLRAENRQIKPPSYLFGCEPKVPIPPPPAAPALPALRPVGARSSGGGRRIEAPPKDPREDLLASIRAFGGKSSLRKVSAR